MLQAQFIFLNGCILSKAEFGKDEACIPYYLQKEGIFIDKQKTKILARYILPIIILGISLVLKIIFNYKPLIF